MKRIAIQILTIVLFFSCSKEEEIKVRDGVQGILKISANMPELEVLTKAPDGSEQAIFAYVATDLENSQLNPLNATIQQGNTYHYEIPDETQKVLFSNIGTAESEHINLSTTSEGLLKLSIKDSVYMGTNQDVVFAYLDNIESGKDQAYQVDFKRMTTELKVRLNLIIDTDTIQQSAEVLEGASLSINGFSQHLLINNDGVAEFSGSTSLKFPLTEDFNKGLSADDIYIFPASGSSHELLLKINQESGQEQIFKTTVNQALEANKYYTLTLNLKKSNLGIGFSLADVIVEETTITEYDKDLSSLLSLSSNNVFLQKELGNTRGIGILTRLESWKAEIKEGSEWLSLDTLQGVNGDTLYFTSLSENTDAFRFGKVLITADQFEQEIVIQQSNGGLQTVVLYPENYCNINIGGENFTVDYNDGNGAQGPYTAQEQYFSSSADSVIIQGENITYLKQEYYNINRISLKDCYSLASLEIPGLQDSIVDFSQAPNLKTLACTGGGFKEIIFAEGTPLETLDLTNSPMTAISLISIHTTLKELNCSSSTNLASIEIYPAEFSGDRKLEKLDISSCTAFSGLNLTNHVNLKELNVNSCSNLEAIVTRNCIALPQLIISHNSLLTNINVSGCTALTKLDFDYLYELSNLRTEGCTNLSDVSLYYCNNLAAVDFANYSQLRILEISSCDSVNKVLLNGCSILEEVTIIGTYPQEMDFTSCSSLIELELTCNKTTDLSLDNCSALSSLSISSPKMTTFDPSVCSALENFKWEHAQNITELDFSQNVQLKSISIIDDKLNDLNLLNCTQLYSIELQDCDSLRTLSFVGENTLKRFVSTNIYNSYASSRLSSLDFSDYTALTYVRIENAPELTTINLNGCIKLEEFYGLNNTIVSSLQTTNCSLLRIFECSNNSQLGSLDFTGSIVLANVDCSYCALNAEKLNAMFTSFPDLSANTNFGRVKIIGNPGAASCDRTIIDDAKSWLFSEK